MFETRPRSEVAVPPAIGGDSRFWSYVQLHLHLPWFYLIVESGTSAEIVLATRREQWLGLTEAYPDRHIRSIQLVSPGWLNGSDHWKMERLHQLWTATDLQRDEATIYVVDTGDRYVESNASSSEASLVDRTLIFDASAQKGRKRKGRR